MQPSRVAIIGTDYPVYEQYCPNWEGMQDGLLKLDIEHHLFTCRPTLDINALVEYQPDLVIYGLIDMVRTPQWRREIRARLPNAKIVIWYGDYRDRRTNQLHADASEVDMMFVSNDAQNDWYEKIWKVPACRYLPLGSKLYEPEYKREYDFPFVFIGGRITGSAFMDRAMVMWKYQDDAGLKIIDGDPRQPTLRAKVFKAAPQIYRSSRVVLDQSHFTDVHRYTSNRHWIITGAGGFALTKRFPGCELDYPEGTRAYFDTYEESIELLDYYLKNEAEREKIRLAGHAHARFHTYEYRFKRMFALLSGA